MFMKICLMVMLMGFSGCRCDGDGTEVHSIEIISVNNISESRGSFFLGSGFIGGVEYFFMFHENGHGGISRIKIPVIGTNIIEKEVKKGLLKWVEHKRHSINCSDNDFLQNKFGCHLTRVRKQFTLIVPKNTVIKRFKID